jgi:hypothetical protein
MFAFFQLGPTEFLVLGLFAGLAVLGLLALAGFLLFLSRRKRPRDD